MAHLASLSQLQRPPYASVNGAIVDYETVKIHVSAEALTRALSIFEGLKGYWDGENRAFGLRTPERHYERLCRSAALLHIPIEFDFQEYVDSCLSLGARLLMPDQDLWFRTTLYVVEGHWGEGTRADHVMTAFTQSKDLPRPHRLSVSTWQRSSDVQLSPRVKCSANYVVARLARMEAHRRGFDDAILLNSAGRVAESTGSCVVALVEDRVVTPPPFEGALSSISVGILEQICREDGVPFDRRPLERTELLVADEVALMGTLTELTPVAEIDGSVFRTDGLLSDLRLRYLDAMRRTRPREGLDFAILSADQL